MDCTNCSNIQCVICQNCLNPWLKFIQDNKTMIHLSSSKQLFSEGDLATGIYIVCSGKIKVFYNSGSVKKNILRLAGAGQILGHRGLSESMVYSVSAETLSDCEIAFIQTEDFFKLIRNNHDLSFFMMLFYANELLRSEQRFRARAKKNKELKVALALVMVLEAFGCKNDKPRTLDLALNARELANFSNVNPDGLEEGLQSLEKKGVIEMNDREIKIIREDELRQISD